MTLAWKRSTACPWRRSWTSSSSVCMGVSLQKSIRWRISVVWTGSRSPPHLDPCATSFGQTLSRTLATRKTRRSILLITLFVGAHTFIGEFFHQIQNIIRTNRGINGLYHVYRYQTNAFYLPLWLAFSPCSPFTDTPFDLWIVMGIEKEKCLWSVNIPPSCHVRHERVHLSRRVIQPCQFVQE